MRLNVIFLADQSAPAVLNALGALASAVENLEATGEASVDVDVVRVHDDPDVQAILTAVSGARLHHLPGTPIAAAWDAALAQSRAEFVYFSTAMSAPESHAIISLFQELVHNHHAVVAFPGTVAAPSFMIRSKFFTEHGGLAGVGVGWALTAPEMSSALAHRLHCVAPQLVAVVQDALVGGVDLVQPARLPHDALNSPQMSIANSNAVTIGAHTYLSPTTQCVTLSHTQRISIGAFCSIADEVRLLNTHPKNGLVQNENGEEEVLQLFGLHRLDAVTTYPLSRWPHMTVDHPGPAHIGPSLVIKNDVWIGFRATVLGPVVIGDGAVIGAGAVVTRDVEPYSIVAGNPARVVGRRCDEDSSQAMLRIAWWNWTEKVIFERSAWFGGPIADFVRRFDS